GGGGVTDLDRPGGATRPDFDQVLVEHLFVAAEGAEAEVGAVDRDVRGRDVDGLETRVVERDAVDDEGARSGVDRVRDLRFTLSESGCRTTLRRSKPPAPPSATPVRAPDGSRLNVSWLLGAPSRFSKPAKVVPATVPPPIPLIVQVESAAGPCSVSFAPPAVIAVVFLKEIELIPPPLTVPVPSPLIVQSEATGELARATDAPS